MIDLAQMSWQDLANGGFELCAGSLLWLNIRQLHQDKTVKGIHIVPTMVFTFWGYWNCYYYPHLNQWISFMGGLVMVLLNTIWIGQMLYYKYGEKFSAIERFRFP